MIGSSSYVEPAGKVCRFVFTMIVGFMGIGENTNTRLRKIYYLLLQFVICILYYGENAVLSL